MTGTISGTVESVQADRFALDYGTGRIIVEMDDGDRDADSGSHRYADTGAHRDSARAAAPLKPADDAVVIDTSALTIAEAVAAALMDERFLARGVAGEKLRLPSLAGGHRRRKRASSLWRDSWYMRVSMAAASRLLAAVMAWISPVRCKLKSSIGTTWL